MLVSNHATEVDQLSKENGRLQTKIEALVMELGQQQSKTADELKIVREEKDRVAV